MSKKKIIIFAIVALLVAVEGYLAFSYILDGAREKRETEEFCKQKCNYSSTSYFWEYSAEGASRGFTTKQECLNFCYKSRMGFAFIVQQYGAAVLSGFGDIFK